MPTFPDESIRTGQIHHSDGHPVNINSITFQKNMNLHT